jgi:polyhydroxyalkanoate synthesis regulator phasin
MSNIKNDILSTLKNIMGFYSEEKFAKVYSDAEIKISQREVGGKVEMIGSDGSLSDAADGDFEMQDGFKFTVKDGLIASIEGQDAPVDEAPKEDVPVQAEAPAQDAPADAPTNEVDDLKQRVADLEAMVAELIQKVEGAAQMAATKDDVAAFTKEVADLNHNIKELAKVPVEFSKTTTNNTVKESREDKLIELARILSKK